MGVRIVTPEIGNPPPALTCPGGPSNLSSLSADLPKMLEMYVPSNAFIEMDMITMSSMTSNQMETRRFRLKTRRAAIRPARAILRLPESHGPPAGVEEDGVLDLRKSRLLPLSLRWVVRCPRIGVWRSKSSISKPASSPSSLSRKSSTSSSESVALPPLPPREPKLVLWLPHKKFDMTDWLTRRLRISEDADWLQIWDDYEANSNTYFV